MELEDFNIQFDYIKGSNSVLADTLSHLVTIDPDTPLTPEGQGYEFGYAVFEEFPKVKTKTYEVNEVIVGTRKEKCKFYISHASLDHPSRSSPPAHLPR